MDLLVNKYKPKGFKDILGNTTTTETLQLIVKHQDMPHLMFTRPPGTGKTTSARILCSALSASVLELNASDERGIDTVRTTIKDFAQQKHTELHRIIILDEADSMTQAAQQAMRRTMEVYSSACKFIIICNVLSKISEPIQSRCAILRFEKIDKEVVRERLRVVCKAEGIRMSGEAIELVVDLCGGDVRYALNLLQPFRRGETSRLDGTKKSNAAKESNAPKQNSALSIENGGTSNFDNVDDCENGIGDRGNGILGYVDEDFIVKLVGQPSPRVVESILTHLVEGRIEEALGMFDELWKDKFEPEEIVGSFFRIAKNMELYEVVRVIGMSQMRISEGVASKLQFYGLFSDISDLSIRR